MHTARTLVALALIALVSEVSAQTGPPMTWEKIYIRHASRGGGITDCALPDLDGDGDLDLALLSPGGHVDAAHPEDAMVPIETWVNDGNGHFTEVKIHPFATDLWQPVAFDWADADGDGDDDVVLWGGSPVREVHPMENQGDRFDYFDITYPAWSVLWNAGARWIEVDGRPALFVFKPTGDVYVFENPACDLTPRVMTASGLKWSGVWINADEGIELLDHDSDGDLDLLLVTGNASSPRLLENQHAQLVQGPRSYFAEHAQASESWQGFCHALGDLDGDGAEDLVVGPLGSMDEGMDQPDLIFPRTNTGFRREPVVIETPFFARSVRCFVADFDVDGRQDILFIGTVNSASYLALNRGDWEFEFHSDRTGHLPPFRYGRSVAVGDIDGDGRPDIFSAADNCLAVYLNKPAPPTEPR